MALIPGGLAGRRKFGPEPAPPGVNCPRCRNADGLMARYFGWNLLNGNRILIFCPACGYDAQLPPELNFLFDDSAVRTVAQREVRTRLDDLNAQRLGIVRYRCTWCPSVYDHDVGRCENCQNPVKNG
jgi:hypothetical protein